MRYIADTGGTYPEREHLFALANKYVIGHFTQMADWASWALEEIETWNDTISPASTHHEETVGILRQLAETPRRPPRSSFPRSTRTPEGSDGCASGSLRAAVVGRFRTLRQVDAVRTS